MSESLESLQPKSLNDPTPAMLDEIRVDSDGSRWKYVRAHYSRAEELEIEKEKDPAAYWDKHLQEISDDAEASVRGLFDDEKVVKDDDDEDEPAFRWRLLEQ